MEFRVNLKLDNLSQKARKAINPQIGNFVRFQTET